MSYATLDDLKNKLNERELVQLTDDNDAGVIDTDKTDDALEAADVEIDSYLGERYTLPLSSVPKIINHVAADLAVINLFNRRNGPPEHWEEVQKKRLAFLEKLKSGDSTLGLEDPEAGSSNQAEVSSSKRVFTRDTLEGF